MVRDLERTSKEGIGTGYTRGVNSKSAIVALGVALVACGVLFWLSGRGGGGGGKPGETELPAWTSGFDPARVTGLRVQWPDGGVAQLEPTPVTDVWLLECDGERWPVATTRIRGALRLIGEMSVGSEAEGEELVGGVVVRLTTPAGEGVVRVGSDVVGGKGWARLEGEGGAPRVAVVDGGFTRLFTKQGLLAWREPVPMLPLPGETMRLKVVAGGLGSEVTRVKGRWGMTVPVGAPADGEFVQAAIARAHGMKVTRVLTAAEASGLGFDEPTAVVVSETRVGGGGMSVVQEAVIGNAADVSGESAYVRGRGVWVEGDGKERAAWGPVVFVVERSSIERLTADPRAYVSKRAVESPAADVLRVVVRVGGGEREYRRELNGWSVKEGAVGEVGALVGLLCEKDAGMPALAEPTGWRAIAEVELSGSGGALAKVVVGEGKGAKGERVLVVKTAEVWREYAWEAGVGAWLE